MQNVGKKHRKKKHSNKNTKKKTQEKTHKVYVRNIYLPLPKRQILDSSKLKAVADDNFEFDGNGRNFSYRVENTVGKGEIAHYEQFLLFPQCFQKTCTADT